MKKSFLKISIIILVVFSLADCKKNEDEILPSFKANLNEIAFEPAAIACSLTQEGLMNLQRLVLIAGDDDTNIISLAIEADAINNCMPTGDYPTEDILITLSYITNNGSAITEHIHTDVDSNSTLSVSITACDNGKISGIFSGTFRKVGVLQDEIVTPELVEVTNGEFKNIPFLVITN